MNTAAEVFVSVRRESEATLLRQHEKLIRWTASEMWRKSPLRTDAAQLEDLVQEGRISLLRAARQWDPERAALWSFARRSVKSDMRDALRREIRAYNSTVKSDHTDEAGVFASVADDKKLASESAELQDDLELLEKEIELLSEVERKVLWNLFGEEKTSRDTAEALGIGHATVGRTKWNALEKLRERMEARA